MRRNYRVWVDDLQGPVIPAVWMRYRYSIMFQINVALPSGARLTPVRLDLAQPVGKRVIGGRTFNLRPAPRKGRK